MSTVRVYSLLSATKTPVKNCSAMLPNRMQCWRAGDYLATETTLFPAVAATQKTPAVDEDVNRREYQLCRFHAVVESGKANPEQPDEPVAAAPVAPAPPAKPTPPSPNPPKAA